MMMEFKKQNPPKLQPTTLPPPNMKPKHFPKSNTWEVPKKVWSWQFGKCIARCLYQGITVSLN